MSEVISGRSRYNCASNPPPDLQKIIKHLGKATRRASLHTQKEVRGVIARCHADYRERGRSDDVARFLFSTRVLLSNTEGQFFFDAERAADVLQACSEGKHPTEPTVTVAERIAQLQQKPTEEAPTEESDEETPDDSYDLPEPEEEAEESPALPEAQDLDIPLAETIPEPNYRQALYLTRVEYEVWEVFLLAQSKDEAGVSSFGLPIDPKHRLMRFKRDGFDCSEAEFLRAIKRFEQSGLLRLRPGNSENLRCEWTPEAYLVKQGIKRVPLRLNRSVIQKVHQHLREFAAEGAEKPTREALGQLLESIRPDYEAPLPPLRFVNLKYILWLYVGRQEACSFVPGVFVPQGEHFIPCHPDFTPYRLYEPQSTPLLVGHMFLVWGDDGKCRPVVTAALNAEYYPPSYDPHLSDDGELEQSFSELDRIQKLSDNDIDIRLAFLGSLDQLPRKEWLGRLETEKGRRNQLAEEQKRRAAERQRRVETLQALKREEEELRKRQAETAQRRQALEDELLEMDLEGHN